MPGIIITLSTSKTKALAATLQAAAAATETDVRSTFPLLLLDKTEIPMPLYFLTTFIGSTVRGLWGPVEFSHAYSMEATVP